MLTTILAAVAVRIFFAAGANAVFAPAPVGNVCPELMFFNLGSGWPKRVRFGFHGNVLMDFYG